MGQLITLLAAPILARLFTPSDFGVLAVYTSTIGTVGALASLQYHQAVLLPEKDGPAAQLLSVALACTLFVSLLSAAVVFACGQRIAGFIGAPGLAPHMWLVPLGILGIAYYEAWSHWSLRKKIFGTLARTRVMQGLAQTGIQLVSGVASLGTPGLLFGQLAGQVVGTTTLVRHAWRENPAAFRAIRPSSMWHEAKQHQRFPIYSTWSVLFSALSMQAPVFLLSFYFGEHVTGLYAVGQRVLMMPVALIAKSTSQVLFSAGAEEERAGTLAPTVERLFASLSRIGLAPAFVLALSAQDVFTLLFGQRWVEAGLFAEWLTPWLFFVFLAFPLMPLSSILQRQVDAMIFQGALLIVRVAGLAVGGYRHDAILAIALFSFGSALSWLAYVLWTFRIAGARVSVCLDSLVRDAARALLIGIPVLGARIAGLSRIGVAASAAVSGLLFVAFLVRGGGSLRAAATPSAHSPSGQ
jgi:O-antigen/teichoic acid export membrane protein